jgi:hypothetical protein
MAKIRVFTENNSVYVAGKSYPAGYLRAIADSGGNVSIYNTSDNVDVIRSVYYSRILDKDGNPWGASASEVVTSLNDFVDTANPSRIMAADNKVNFTAKAGYTVIVGQDAETITSSSKLLFTGSDVGLGANLDVKNYDITTTTTNGEIRITPNGTGSVNLDGTVQFKRFDTTDPANIPTAEPGKMYADQNDNLFFGVS